MRLESHPAAEIFPMLSRADLESLKTDIRTNGQREPIVLFDDKIIDGRNRYLACEELGIEPELCELESCPDPIAYVLSLNLHRRHLTPGERATVAAKIETLRQGRPSKDANLHLKRSHVGTMLAVSPRSVADAKKVLEKGHDSLIEKMESGEIAPSLAAKFVDAVPDKKQQAKDVAKGKAAVREAVKEATPEPEKPAEKPLRESQSDSADKFTPEKPARFKQFLRFWDECDDEAKAAIRAFILTEESQ